MAQTYANMDAVLQNEAAKMKKDVTDPSVSTKVNDLLWNMITVSDNESFNELVLCRQHRVFLRTEHRL